VLVSALLKGPVMVEKSGDSDILDDAAVGRRNAAALQMGLLARMSHEMRTPLSAILGFAQLIESGAQSLTVSQKKNIDRILQAGWYLDKLMNMTRDLALSEAGSLALSLEPVSLAAVMLDVEAIIASQRNMRGIRVTFPLFEAPCSVSADRIRLQEVLHNLLCAAIDHSEMGGMVVVHCETHSPEWIRIVIDDGRLVSADRPMKSFQPFDGLEQKATAAHGTGLGLLLAERLVRLMGGAIAVEILDGARKAFSFNLKRMQVPMAAGRASTHATIGETPIPTGGRAQSMIYSPDNHAHQP
jgi:signal transduction histidine kinase